MAQTHKQMYEKLLKRMDTYHPSKDFSIITRVYDFAVKAHGSQLRKSGDPYMIHPMAVALLLVDLKCDIETIAGGILHDVVEDTEVTEEEIAKKFGKEIAELVKLIKQY
ncbi:MAG: HD domain-containing protein, partial [Clostridiales bacterium]|nr:HD domain-containing protein [Clostridiales bacterium]